MGAIPATAHYNERGGGSMKAKVSNIIRRVFAYAVIASLFMFTLVSFLWRGEGIGCAIFSAVLVTVGVFLIVGLLFFLWWRLFTSSGRKAEEEAQARAEIRKLERKRDREWRRMNW